MDKMPASIGDFSHTEYLIVFNTIVFGIVGTEYFSGWGAILRNRNHVRFYWLHIVWTVFSFLIFTQNWYGIWPRTKYITYNFLYFIFSLIPLLLYYLISVVLFPNFKQKETVDLRVHFFQNARPLMLIHAIYFLFTISASFVYEDHGDVFRQNIIRSGAVLLCLCAAYWHEKVILHILFLTFGIAGLIQFVLAIPK